MLGRSIISAVRPVNGFRVTAASSALRCFSTTAPRGVRAVFSETQNPELNAVLKKIQETIIFPAYLPERQRELIFDPTRKQHLQQNPIVIELEGVEHKFTTLDRFRDVPNSKKILNAALRQMKTREDFENLETLLAGYEKAGVVLKHHHTGKIVRVAGVHGQANIIIECAKQADKTGLRLDNSEHVTQLLISINQKITDSNWSAKEAEQASKWAELVLDLVQRPEHVAKGIKPADKMHFSAVIRGLMMFAESADIKIKQAAGKDVTKQLEGLTETVKLLITLWGDVATRGLTHVRDLNGLKPHPEGATKDNQKTSYLSGSSYVQAVSQNIKGIAIARELLEDVAAPLEPVQAGLEQYLQEFAAQHPRSSLWARGYEKVMGQKPNWPTTQ